MDVSDRASAPTLAIHLSGDRLSAALGPLPGDAPAQDGDGVDGVTPQHAGRNQLVCLPAAPVPLAAGGTAVSHDPEFTPLSVMHWGGAVKRAAPEGDAQPDRRHRIALSGLGDTPAWSPNKAVAASVPAPAAFAKVSDEVVNDVEPLLAGAPPVAGQGATCM